MCLNSHKCQNMLIEHKDKCKQKQEITTITTSDETHLYWKNHFQKNPSCFWIIADFESVNEIDNSSIGNKIINLYKQNAVFNGYYIVSELDDFLKMGYYESPLG